MNAAVRSLELGPPRDHELERDVLGAVMSCADIASWREATREPLALVRPDDFDDTWARRVFLAMTNVVARGDPDVPP